MSQFKMPFLATCDECKQAVPVELVLDTKDKVIAALERGDQITVCHQSPTHTKKVWGLSESDRQNLKGKIDSGEV
jgi:hypothetical protein